MSINRILADLGKAVDSSSTGNFLSKEASGAEFNPVQWSDINSAPTILDSALASAIIDSAYIQARQSGVGSGGIDSATTIALIDSSYVAARASTGGSGFVKYQYTATASQTTFQDSDANGNVLSYDADYILVHYNGVLLPSADYTATDGSSVVLATGADSGSIIGIAKWGAAAGSSSGGSSLSFTWGGDRGIVMGGNGSLNIDFFSIATPGNASDFNADVSSSLGYSQGACAGDGTKVVYAGNGNPGTAQVHIQYVTAATLGTCSDAGDLTSARMAPAAAGDGTYAYYMGGWSGSTVSWPTNAVNIIDYFTVSTLSNATDFGDLLLSETDGVAGSDSVYVVRCGGYSSSSVLLNTIEYFSTASAGNASNFGDMLNTVRDNAGVTDTTRFVMTGGLGSSTAVQNVIQYIEIQTVGNATDFGDLNVNMYNHSGCSDGTYGVFCGGSTESQKSMCYITIQTTSNATDFGDLFNTHTQFGCASGASS